MNQTINANISGIVFHVDIDAYELLKEYLGKIKSHFSDSEERTEIMQDIEMRIAELFSETIKKPEMVVNKAEVERVIKIMGKPEQYIIDKEDDTDYEKKESSYNKDSKSYTDKKLFRNPDERILGGVASGIAAYLNVDTVWVRLFFVIAAVFIGFGFPAYIVLWIAMPEAKTVADKLKMKGEPINIESIKKTFDYEAGRVNESFKHLNSNKFIKKFGPTVENIFKGLGDLIIYISKAFIKIIALITLFVGLTLLMIIFLIYSGLESMVSLTSNGVMLVQYEDLLNLVLVSDTYLMLALIGIFLLVSIPVFSLIYFSSIILFNVKKSGIFGTLLFLLFLIGFIISLSIGLNLSNDYSKTQQIENKQTISKSENVFNIIANDSYMPGKPVLESEFPIISFDKDSIYQGFIHFSVLKSKTNDFYFEETIESKGNSHKDALQKAENVGYFYQLNDSSLFLNKYLSVPKGDRLKGQAVSIKLYLPLYQVIYLDNSLKNIIYDVKNVSNTNELNMLSKKWVMLESGLTCLECDDEIVTITIEELEKLRSSN
jgi:phage shock protein PspC (stress-responsive transcriptional regulator)